MQQLETTPSSEQRSGRKASFLKRGEGVQRRVLAPRSRPFKPISSPAPDDAAQSADQDFGGHRAAYGSSYPQQSQQAGRWLDSWADVHGREPAEPSGDEGELAAETHLVDLNESHGAWHLPCLVPSLHAGHLVMAGMLRDAVGAPAPLFTSARVSHGWHTANEVSVPFKHMQSLHARLCARASR